MAMNPFEALEIDQNKGGAETIQSQSGSLIATEAPEEDVKSAQTVEDKRKMWQIFTDDNGDIQRKSFPIEGNGQGQDPISGSSPTNTQPDPLSKELESVILHSEQVTDASLFGSLNGFANPNAKVITQNGDVTFQLPPKKPPRRVEILPRSGGNPPDTVVFQKDTTYTRFDTIEVESDEELFGDGENSHNTSEEHHYVGNKVLIRSESDLDILLKSPKKRIWLFNSKYCCVSVYKWPLLRSYIKVIGVGLGMTALYVAVVLIIVFSMSG